MDKIDREIISLMIPGFQNKEISKQLAIPLSTVQRRTRKIIHKGLVNLRIQPYFKKMGLKKGLLHLYIKNGDIKETAQRVSKFNGIIKSSIHVGNSDVVSEFIYKNSQELIDTIIKIKGLNSIERVLWSEEIVVVPIDSRNIAETFKKIAMDEKVV